MTDSMDGPSPALRRYQSECRRVGVSEAELRDILRARVELFLKEHPDVRTRLEREYPNLDLDPPPRLQPGNCPGGLGHTS